MRLMVVLMSRWFVALVGVGLMSGVGFGQTFRWDGGTNNLWSDATNWTLTSGVGTAPPNSASTIAVFSGGSANTAVSLGGGTFSLAALQYDTATAAAYSISNGTGTLQFASGGSISITNTVTTNQSISASVAALGPFTLNNSSATAVLTISGAVSGGSGLDKTGSGLVALTGANTYSGATTISAGTLAAQGASPFGTSNVVNNAALNLSNASVGPSNAISGTGTVNQLAGTSFLTGTNTYTGTTTISGGVLVVGNGTTTGTLGTGNVVNNAQLGFARINPHTVGNVISGTGSLAVNGTPTLTAANTYTGFTVINSGTITISADNNLGTAPSSAIANHLRIMMGGTLATTSSFTLNINRGIALDAGAVAPVTINTAAGTTLTVPGVLQGGTLNKAGTGTLELTGTNLYSGTTSVSAGTLRVGSGGTTGTLGNEIGRAHV